MITTVECVFRDLILRTGPRTGHEGTDWDLRYSSDLSLTSMLNGGAWLRPRPDRFNPGNNRDPLYDIGWLPGPVWKGA